MAVPEQTPYIEHVANGVTTSFALGFVCDSADNLVVTINDLPTNVGDWSFSDGNVVFQYPPLLDSLIKIWRNSPLVRSTTFKTYDNSLNPNSLNFDLDKIWLVMQELNVKNFISDNKLQEILDSLIAGNINGLPAEILARIAGDENTKILVNLEANRAYQAEIAINNRVDNEALIANQNVSIEKVRAEEAEQNLLVQINAVGVGNKAYKTYALMDADKENIPAKSKVTVTNDATALNNGDWQWDGIAFTKSTYDPLTQAKSYSDAKTNLDSSKDTLKLVSANGSTLLLMTKRRKLYVAGIKGALQDVIAAILSKTDRFIMDTLKNALFSVKDNANNTRLLLSAKNNVFCNDVVTKKTSLSKVDERLAIAEKTVEAQSLKYFDHVLAVSKNEPIRLVETTIFLEDSVEGRLQLFSPVLLRISKNKFLVFSESRTGGDFGDISLVYKAVTVNSDYSLSISNYSILANNENVDGVGFDCYNTCALKTSSGRIIVYYTKRFKSHETFTSLDFCCKTSDDDGATWSAERVLNDQFPDYATRRWVLAGPGKAIQLKHGKYKGRIVVPCYGAMDGSYPVSSTGQMRSFLLLSDDNGQTYKMGASSTILSSNECSVAETIEGDIVFLTRNSTNYKTVELSNDGGLTSKNTKLLKDPLVAVCQVGFAQAENQYDLQTPKLLMTAPADTLRRDLTLYLSYDNGQTFEKRKQLMNGTASYSDVDVIDDSHIFVVYAFNNRRISGIVVNLKTVYGA